MPGTIRFALPLMLALAATPALARAADADADAGTIATTLLDRLDAGEYAQAEAMFDERMAQAVPVEKLQAVWESLPVQAGAAKGRGQPESAAVDGATVVRIPLHYENAEIAAKVAIDADGKIAGFLVQPADTAAAVPAPEVDAGASFAERDVAIGEGERALPGTLSMPKGNSEVPGALVPAVVLVHGSGPQDRDESIGPNKPFLDLARGLAAQGIAVLRYEKRTHARPQDFSGVFSIDDETTNDAVLAVDVLRRTPGIDPNRVFVLGHSQGGMMAPRIAAVSSHVAGLVLFAAPSRSLLDILVEQNRRLAVLDDGKTSDAERSAIEALQAQVRATRDASTADDAKTVLGQPAGYWRSVERVDPVAEAARVALPMLFLQGARDIQVVDADWQGWRDAFHDDPKATFKLYESLNHLGIAGKGDGNLAEYGKAGHVDAQLIADTAAWIKAH